MSDLHPPTQLKWTNTCTHLHRHQVTKLLHFQSCRPKGFSSCQSLPCASLLKLQDFSWSREALELSLCFASPDYIDHIDWSQQLCSCKDQLNIRGSLGPMREQHSPLHQLNVVAQDTDFAASVIKYVSALGLILVFMRNLKTICKDNCPMRSFLHYSFSGIH